MLESDFELNLSFDNGNSASSSSAKTKAPRVEKKSFPPKTTSERFAPSKTTSDRFIPPKTSSERFVPSKTSSERFVPPKTNPSRAEGKSSNGREGFGFGAERNQDRKPGQNMRSSKTADEKNSSKRNLKAGGRFEPSKEKTNGDAVHKKDLYDGSISFDADDYTAPNSKYKSLSIEEDPLQYHAKPRDLSRNALKRPLTQMSHSSHIFTRTPFSTLNLDKRLTEHLEKAEDDGGMALLSCTRVQSVVISSLESKQNILMKSETGSGKTMAYLLPIIDDLLKLPTPVQRSQGTYAFILAPTRELCSQIADVIESVTKCCVSIVGGCISGGERRKSEKARLRKGVSILVSTPGRLLDHLRATESFTLNNLRWVVLDEADRLLDMGFEQTILEICSIVSGVVLPGLKEKNSSKSEKQSQARTNLANKWQQQSLQQSKVCAETNSLSFIMASATLTKAVKHLAMPVMGGKGFLVVDAERNSVQQVHDLNDLLALGKDVGRLDGSIGNEGDVIDFVGEQDGEGKGGDDQPEAKRARRAGDLDKDEVVEVPEQLSQYFMMVTCKWRLAALASFLRLHKDEKVMVFFATCDSVDYHALLFRNTEWPQELDAPLPVPTKDADGNNKSQPQGPKPSADQFLDPLEYTFTGLLGDDCNMYRLHGNVPQASRKLVYKQFCKATKGVLLCTDVAARGLDLPKVDWIVQYDPPCETTDYVHRIGRTARKGNGGNALIFLLPSEAPYIQLLQSHGMAPRPLSLQNLFVESSAFIPGAGKFTNVDEMTAVILQRRMEGVVFRNRYLMDAGRQAFRSFVRAYATHSSDAKGIFKVQSLHLGHVAKCFALRESPNALRNHDDVIGRVFNGMYTKAVLGDQKLSKKSRDEKYALSKGGGKKDQKGGKREADSGSSSKPPPALSKNEKQKIRSMGGNSGGLAPSGSFRKTSGYFRKKLRASANAEFQS